MDALGLVRGLFEAYVVGCVGFVLVVVEDRVCIFGFVVLLCEVWILYCLGMYELIG